MRTVIASLVFILACSVSQAQVGKRPALGVAEPAERSEREPAEQQNRGRSIRELDAEREQQRRARDAEWRRSMQEQKKAQPQELRSAPPLEAAKPKSSSETAKPQGSSRGESHLRVACHAAPVCPPERGKYKNVCRAVERSYSGANAMSAGSHDIVRRCVAANSPDPCSGDCARLCSSTARCTYAAK